MFLVLDHSLLHLGVGSTLKANSGDSAIDNSATKFSNSDPDLDDTTQLLSPFKRQIALNNLLEDSSPELMEDLFKQAHSVSPKHLQYEVKEAIVRRYALIEPEKAFALIASSAKAEIERELLTVSLFEEWSIFGIDEAVAYATQLSQPDSNWALKGIWASHRDLSDHELRSIARKLGEEAALIDLRARAIVGKIVESPRELWFQLVGDYGSNFERLTNDQRQALSYVAHAWVRRDGTEAYGNVMQAFSGNAGRSWILCELLKRFFQEDTTVAIGLANQARNTNREVLLTAIGNWAEDAGWSAFEAAQHLDRDAGGDPSRLQREAIVSWAQNKPHALIEAVPDLPPGLQDWSFETALMEMSHKFPESVPEFLKDVSDIGRRHTIISDFVNWWADIDPLAAYEWVSNDPLTAADRFPGSDTYYALLDPAVRRNPYAAMQIALDFPVDETMGEGLEAEVIGRIASRDVDWAVELLESARDHDTRNSAMSTIGLAMIRAGSSGRAIELVSEESEKDQLLYFASFAWMWATEKPKDLLAKFDSLPSDKVKQSCSWQLLKAHQREPFLAAEDLEIIRPYLHEWELELLEKTLEK